MFCIFYAFDKNSRNCSRNSREKDKQQSEEKNKIMNFDNSDWLQSSNGRGKGMIQL